MQQHLQRLDGVDKAEVSLRDGQVVVHSKPEATIDPARIFKATYDSGVSVAEMEMTARGEMLVSGDTLSLRTDEGQSFTVTANALAEKLRGPAGSGGTVSVRARLYQKPAGAAAATKSPPALSQIEILEILEGSNP